MKEHIQRLFLTTLCLACVSSLPLAQSNQKTQPQPSQVAISATTGKEAVCEGGVEIIPSGLQSFARKRYIAAHPKAKNKLTKSRSRK